VHRYIPPTPQYCWPLLSRRLGCEVWVKHENHAPTGAFKVRGGIFYLDEKRRAGVETSGLVVATRGNHGQSVAFAGKLFDFKVAVVVPEGNSDEKNNAVQALGGELIIHGSDFQAAFEFATDLANERNLLMVPSFDPLLVKGVSSYALELFSGMPTPDRVYVPIGLGSGVCGLMAARDALGVQTSIVGVVSSGAPAYALSVSERRPVECAVSTRICDGIAIRKPDSRALERMSYGLEKIIEVTDTEVANAMRILFSETHNVAEGAGAAALAAAIKESAQIAGKRVAVILSGGNVDREVFARILQGHEANNSHVQSPHGSTVQGAG
jgi:threonine dehydratase